MKLATLCGSTRAQSHNLRLLALAVREARALGAEVDEIDLKALALPMYDGDLEAASRPSWPPSVVELRDRLAAVDGLIVASPEHNFSVPAVLKNALDWASRGPAPFVLRDKVALLVGASPGAAGTARMQVHMRAIFGTLGIWAVPSGFQLGFVEKAFDEKGDFVDAKRADDLRRLVKTLVEWPGARRA